MRVALISAQHRIDDVSGDVRGLLSLGGRSAAMLQLDLALRLGCERVVCLATGLSEGIMPLLHRAERAGASFHALNGARALSGLVKAADELFVFAEGLVPDPLAVGELIGERSGIVTLPGSPAVEEGFERIDRERAWAGAARISGSTVERLAEIPSDADPISSLLRVGLQMGTRLIPLPKSVRADGRWVLLRDRADMRRFEEGWLRRKVEPATLVAPGLALADRAALALAPRLLARRGARAVLTAGAGLGLCGAIAAGWGQFAGVAFGAVALGGLLFRAGRTVGRVARDVPPKGHFARILGHLPKAAMDLAIVAIASLVAPRAVLASWLFAALMLLGLVRLGEVAATPKVSALFSDRVVLAGLLAIGAAFGATLPAFQVVALACLGLLIWTTRRSELTQT